MSSLSCGNPGSNCCQRLLHLFSLGILKSVSGTGGCQAENAGCPLR